MKSTIRNRLVKMGVRFNEPAVKGDVDIEKTIVDALEEGRSDPRVFWSILAWLRVYSDLASTTRLKALVKRCGSSATLGVVSELAGGGNGNRRLRSVMHQCQPLKKKEVLFHKMAEMAVTRNDVVQNALPFFKKWGFYCNGVRNMEKALCNRSEILKRNRILRLRALLGTTIRADIMHWLMGNTKGHARKIANKLSLSYQPIHAELSRLADDCILTAENIGNIRVYSLPEQIRTWLEAEPVPCSNQ